MLVGRGACCHHREHAVERDWAGRPRCGSHCWASDGGGLPPVCSVPDTLLHREALVSTGHMSCPRGEGRSSPRAPTASWDGHILAAAAAHHPDGPRGPVRRGHAGVCAGRAQLPVPTPPATATLFSAM